MLIWTIIIILSVVLDQLVKWIVVKTLPLYDSIVLIENFFSLTHIQNRGAAWGIFSGQRWIFIIITAIALVVLPLILYKYRNVHPLFNIAMSLIIGGAAGNMIDRLFLGYVVDFLEFTFIDFPVFNIADICIVVGTGLMVVYILFFDKTFFADKKKTEKMTETEKESSSNDGTHDETL